MNGLKLLSILQNLDLRSFRTQDVANLTQCSLKNTTHHLSRLEKCDLVIKLKRGLWCLPDKIQKWALPHLLTAPIPSYVSLYSALFYHGLIEQIPEVVYAVTAGRTNRVTNSIGTVSFHHLDLKIVAGYVFDSTTGVAMAEPEKALVDTFYLQSSRSKLFHRLPEIEIPKDFDFQKAEKYARLISHDKKYFSTLKNLEQLQNHI